MTPQQQDKMSGLNALGGCLFSLLIFALFPTLLVFMGLKPAVFFTLIGMIIVVVVISKAKENV